MPEWMKVLGIAFAFIAACLLVEAAWHGVLEKREIAAWHREQDRHETMAEWLDSGEGDD